MLVKSSYIEVLRVFVTVFVTSSAMVSFFWEYSSCFFILNVFNLSIILDWRLFLLRFGSVVLDKYLELTFVLISCEPLGSSTLSLSSS